MKLITLDLKFKWHRPYAAIAHFSRVPMIFRHD